MKKHIHNLSATGFLILFTLLPFYACSQKVVDNVDKKFDNITSVNVEGSFCNVKISGEKRFDTSLKGEILSNKNYDIKIRYQKEGQTLKVWLDRPRSIRGQVKGNITLKVPFNTNINVVNSSGNVLVENTGKADIKLTASSGNVSAKNIDSKIIATASSGNLYMEDITGDVHATTASGSVFISAIKGDLYSVSSSGSQKIEGVKGNLKITSSSGSQMLNMINGNVNSRASSGSIKAVQVNGNLTAVSSSGSIKLDNVTGVLNLTSSSGSQKGTKIKLTGSSSFKGVSGSITMELLNSKDDLSFELKASSGSLYAKGSTGRDKLIISGGPITVYGKTSSGSQYYK